MGTAIAAIFTKYIDVSAPLQINISSGLRRRLISLFDQVGQRMLMMELQQMDGANANPLDMSRSQAKTAMALFEKAADEVSHLLNGSFTRYKGTEVFYEVSFRRQHSSGSNRSGSR